MRRSLSVFLTLLAVVGAGAFRQARSAEPYVIDLATTLRLAGAQNLDVQLARNAVDQAHAGYTSAREFCTKHRAFGALSTSLGARS